MRRLGVPRFGWLGDHTPLIAPREGGSRAFRMSSQGIVTDEGTFCLRDCIDKCRTLHSVIRVVRTSTTEVDRRKAIRHQIDLPCRLNVHGHAAYTARVTDISEGGASIRDGPSLPAGTRAELALDGIGFMLPCVIRAGSDDSLHLMFELDATTRVKFQPVLERPAQRRAA